MELTLTKIAIRDGIWTGDLVARGGDGMPRIEATHDGRPVAGVELVPVEGRERAWRLRVPVPSTALTEGVQAVLIRDAASGAHLASFAVLTGEELDEDLRAEVALLRAELDMLKRAFRRHCVETAG